MNNMSSVYDEWIDFLDKLEKGKKDLTKLVPVQKQITRKGKTYTTTVYVSPAEAKKDSASSPKGFADFKVPKGAIPAVEVQKHLRPIRKILGTERYKEYLEACGVKWEKNTENAGADTMRASSAAKKFLESGGQLNVELFEHMKNGGSASDFKKKNEPKLVVEDKPKPEAPKAPEPKPEAPKELDVKVGDYVEFKKPGNGAGEIQRGTVLGYSSGKWKILRDGEKQPVFITKKNVTKILDKKDKPKEAPKLVVEDKPKPKEEVPKQLKPWERIKNSKSQKEISDILKKTYGMNHVELDAMDLETAKMAGLEVDRMTKKFPEIKKSALRNFGTHKEVRKAIIDQVGGMWGVDFGKMIGNKVKMSKNTHAYHITWGGSKMSPYGNGIHLNNEIFAAKNIKKGEEHLKDLKDSGWLSTGSARGTIVHEIGHAVHKAYDAEVTPKLRAIMKSHNIKEIETGLSMYGKSKFVEFVAEAFAEYYTSPNPRPIAKEVGAVFEEVAVIKYKTK